MSQPFPTTGAKLGSGWASGRFRFGWSPKNPLSILLLPKECNLDIMFAPHSTVEKCERVCERVGMCVWMCMTDYASQFARERVLPCELACICA